MGRRVAPQGRGKDEAEKPFWISYADLMTALMVLFLVVMAVALLAVTRKVSEQEMKAAKHKADIEGCMAIAVEAAKKHDGVKIDLQRNVIDFGDRANFDDNSSLLKPEQEAVLRRFVPELLAMSDNATCKRVLKRIVVEGYTSKTGTYLANLHLSLMRSQRVLCAMFKNEGANPLSPEQKKAVRDVFLVGGFAFNASKETAQQSRRVEMRIEFLGIDEKRASPQDDAPDGFGTCSI
jgi:outer membrane protein OmpA-like peptidoglycan-associated protein